MLSLQCPKHILKTVAYDIGLALSKLLCRLLKLACQWTDQIDRHSNADSFRTIGLSNFMREKRVRLVCQI